MEERGPGAKMTVDQLGSNRRSSLSNFINQLHKNLPPRKNNENDNKNNNNNHDNNNDDAEATKEDDQKAATTKTTNDSSTSSSSQTEHPQRDFSACTVTSHVSPESGLRGPGLKLTANRPEYDSPRADRGGLYAMIDHLHELQMHEKRKKHKNKEKEETKLGGDPKQQQTMTLKDNPVTWKESEVWDWLTSQGYSHKLDQRSWEHIDGKTLLLLDQHRLQLLETPNALIPRIMADIEMLGIQFVRLVDQQKSP